MCIRYTIFFNPLPTFHTGKMRTRSVLPFALSRHCAHCSRPLILSLLGSAFSAALPASQRLKTRSRLPLSIKRKRLHPREMRRMKPAPSTAKRKLVFLSPSLRGIMHTVHSELRGKQRVMFPLSTVLSLFSTLAKKLVWCLVSPQVLLPKLKS